MKLSRFIRMLLVTAVLLATVGAGFAQMGEVADPVPYPEGVQLGDNPIVRFPLSELLTYQALDSYSEPAWVAALVEAGELPPGGRAPAGESAGYFGIRHVEWSWRLWRPVA